MRYIGGYWFTALTIPWGEKRISIFISDGQLQYYSMLLLCSYLGLTVNFLFNAVHTMDLCFNIPILVKVMEAITCSIDQVTPNWDG